MVIFIYSLHIYIKIAKKCINKQACTGTVIQWEFKKRLEFGQIEQFYITQTKSFLKKKQKKNK